jgi:hypothetical protein
MPAKSGPQYRAMAAAMSGHSTLGIPASVGREFVKATPPEKRSRFAKRKRGKKSHTLDRLRALGKR